MLDLQKYNSTWTTLHENKPAKFQISIMRFDEIINKIVIQDGGPDAILNISVISNARFTKT